MKTILVTGGLGFVGSHLVDKLLQQPCHLYIVDNKSSCVVEELAYHDQCDVEVTDIEHYNSGSVYFDEIYHLADIAGPSGVLPHAGNIGPCALAGLRNILTIAKPKTTKILFVSSSEIYGRPGQLAEEDYKLIYSPYTVRLEYAVAKALCEITAMNAAQSAGYIVNIVRPFNIAGPRQSSQGGFVVPRFFESALTGMPIQVFGDGEQIRAFTHVSDLVEGLIAVMNSGKSSLILNAGNPQNTVTINELALRIRSICRSPSAITHVDPKTIYGDLYNEAFDKVPDITRIKNILQWNPKRSLDDILTDVYNTYKEKYSA